MATARQIIIKCSKNPFYTSLKKPTLIHSILEINGATMSQCDATNFWGFVKIIHSL